MDFIEEALMSYERQTNCRSTSPELKHINSRESIDNITLLLKDLHYLKMKNRRDYRLNVLIHLLNKNFGFNGFNIEIEEILLNSETAKYCTTVSVILSNDSTIVTATSKTKDSVKKSITSAIKLCILFKFEKLYNDYINNQ